MTARAQKMPAARLQNRDEARAFSPAALQPSAGERALATLIVWNKLPAPEWQYRFDPVRKWRFDAAWPLAKLAVEIDGGTFVAGRHTRGKGYERDAEKYNAAVLAGWRVLRFTTDMVTDGRALVVLERAMPIDSALADLYR